jgi:hypothetical protein
MMCCSRCREASYCYGECQKIDWPRHKVSCGWYRDAAAVFEAQNIDELVNNKVWALSFAPILSKETEQLKSSGKNINPFKYS